MKCEKYKVVVTESLPTEIVTCGILLWIGVKGIDEGREIHRHIKEHCPCTLVDGVGLEKATEIKEMIEASCGSAEIHKSKSETTSILWPPANCCYERRKVLWMQRVLMKKKGRKEPEKGTTREAMGSGEAMGS